MTTQKSVADKGTVMAAVQVVFGIIIFTSAWWLPEENRQTGLFVFGFLTVLLGIGTAVLFAVRR